MVDGEDIVDRGYANRQIPACRCEGAGAKVEGIEEVERQLGHIESRLSPEHYARFGKLESRVFSAVEL